MWRFFDKIKKMFVEKLDENKTWKIKFFEFVTIKDIFELRVIVVFDDLNFDNY